MDPNNIEFQAVIESGAQGGAYVAIPFDVEQVFGQKRVKIKHKARGAGIFLDTENTGWRSHNQGFT